jgi:serine/threonine-protein kinase
VSALDPRGKRLQGLLAGRFEILQFLGKGGFAAVYKVKNETLGRLEALKILLEDHTGEEDFGIRFLHEARVAASLEHPNIVKIYEFGEVEGLCWYSMQYIPGGTLSSDLKNKGRLTRTRPCASRAPSSPHSSTATRHGIVHRDVKPDNVILDESGTRTHGLRHREIGRERGEDRERLHPRVTGLPLA